MSFIYKYKLYHLPFWFAYHFMWWTLTIGSVSLVFDKIFHSPYVFKFLFGVLFQAIGVYFNLYCLIPAYLEKGRYILYISLLLLTIGLTAAFLVTGYYATAAASENSFTELFNMSAGNYMYIFKANALPSTVASMTLAMSVKLTKNWIQARKKQQTLEKEKLETELQFLRSQLNPHFLFNTINSIFVLINKNPVEAQASLAKFSDLLRYQLYECNEYKIPVGQEIRYLLNFVELEKLRQDSAHLKLAVTIEAEKGTHLAITPFVLMPFIENAFKHVSQQKGKPHEISIDLRFEENLLLFSIENSISPQATPVRELISYGGIGLNNVQRRLQLIYPDAHQLTIKQEENIFKVALRLELQEQKQTMPHTATNTILK